MSTRFATDTAVESVGGGVWTGRIAEGWDIVGHANGGYLLALAGRAVQQATDRPDPVTVTAHYLSPGRPGPIRVEVDVQKEGRAFSTAIARLHSEERLLLVAVAAFGDLTTMGGPERVDASPPELPAPDDCVKILPSPDGFPPPFMGRVDLRLHPDDAGFASGSKSGVPRVRGWFRFPDEPLESLALLVAVDAFPPTVFNADLPVAWTPTVELTAHLRARPAPGTWLRCAFTSRFITGGFLEEDGELWDEDGHVVAQSRQLALVPRG